MSATVVTPRRSPLHLPAFRALWSAGLTSEAGDWLMFIALPVVVFRLTGSALSTSLTFLAELVPGVLLAPLAGRLADRLDRRRLLVVVSVLQGLLLVGLLLVHDRGDLPILYAVVVGEASLLAVFEPARSSLVPELVDADELVRANSLSGLATNLARLVGGPLGGVAVATGGLALVAACDLVTYLVAAVVLALGLPRSGAKIRSGTDTVAEADPSDPADPICTTPERPLRRLLPDLVVWGVAGAAQGIFVGGYVVFVEHRLGGGAGEVGLLRGIQSVGSIAAGLIAVTALRRVSPSRLLVWSAVVFGILDLAIWNLSIITTEVAVFAGLFVAVGAPGVLLGVGLMSRLQLVAPAAGVGRAFAYAGLAANVGQGVGLVAAGLAGDAGRLLVVLEVQGVLYLVLGLAAAVIARRVRPDTGWRSGAVRG